MRRLKFLLNDIRLTLHWHYIRKLRREAVLLLDRGAACVNPRLVRYSNQILRHGMVVSKIWNSQKQYAPCYIDTDLDEPDHTAAPCSIA